VEAALAPPIRPVYAGSGSSAITIGDEQVLYRHEKTFIHQPGIAILITDSEPENEAEDKVKKLAGLQFSWVGKSLRADMLALHFTSGTGRNT